MLGQVEPLTCMRHSLRYLTTCALSQVICYPQTLLLAAGVSCVSCTHGGPPLFLSP